MKLFHPSFLFSGFVIIFLLNSKYTRPYIKAFRNIEQPQLILVLGGDVSREYLGVKLAKAMGLPLIISGGSNPEFAEWLIEKSTIPSNLVTLDYRAEDTLGNFTSIIDDLLLKEVKHALLITSKDHMSRAMLVGNIIAGSRGIRLTSISAKCAPRCKEETLSKKTIDLIRALTWVITKKDPKLFLQNLYQSQEKLIFKDE